MYINNKSHAGIVSRATYRSITTKRRYIIRHSKCQSIVQNVFSETFWGDNTTVID